MSLTRVQYAVRCRSKFDPTIWVDMWVLAAVCVVAPNQIEKMYVVSGGAANPHIIDNTGDGGNSFGSPDGASRVSHMERFTSATDPTQIIDLEFLDGFTILQPNYAGQGGATDEHPVSNYEDDQGHTDTGRDGLNVPHGFFMPVGGAVPYISDSFGLGLGQSYTSDTTRACHVNIVTSDGSTDDQNTKPYPLNPVPPVGVSWLASIKTDLMSFIGCNSNFHLLGWPHRGSRRARAT